MPNLRTRPILGAGRALTGLYLGLAALAGACGDPGKPSGSSDAGADSGSETNSVDSTPPEVEGITCNRAVVRQGESGITVTVVGKDLSHPTDLAFGDLKATLESGGSATKFEVTVSVPHGVPLGAKDFSFSTARGGGRRTALLAVSAITVAPDGSDDNRGSSDDPFRSFKQAVNVSAANDTILLKSGRYDAASGEDWRREIPDGVLISGEGPETRLIGPGVEGGSVNVDGLHFKNSATVKNLTLGHFRYNLLLDKPGQKIELEGVTLTGSRSYAVYLSTPGKSTELTLKDSTIEDCTGPCLYVYGDGAKLASSGGKIISLNSYAIQIHGVDASLSVDGTEISGGANSHAIQASQQEALLLSIKNAKLGSGISVYSSAETPKGELSLENTVLEVGGTGSAIEYSGAKLTVTNCQISSASHGIQQRGGTATIRDTSISDYTHYGYYFQQGKLDLGTELEPGGNRFQSAEAGNRYGLYDERTSVAVDPITVSDTTFNGNMPAAGTIEATAMSPVNEANRYRIYAVGNKIVFY
jgi:hypothetical protein